MHRVRFLGTVLCLALPLAAWADIRVDQSERDLGRIYRDEPQKVVYRLWNESPDTLHVFDWEPSCDCTTAEIIPNPVPPGGDAEVLVFFDPMGYEGKGFLKEYVRLMTSDRKDPEVMLHFRTDVAIGPEPEPRALKFGRICSGQTDTMEVFIKPGSKEPLKVLEAYSDTACVLVERAGTGQQDETDFRVIARHTEACGRVATFVTFVTSDTLRPTIRVPITVSLVGRIVADPDMVAFGPVLPGAYAPQTVRIYSREGLHFDIARVLSTIAELEPQIERESDDSFNMRLKVREDANAQRVSGEIRLETDCPDEPPVVIQVTGYIRSDR
jgi:hypothetical protein